MCMKYTKEDCHPRVIYKINLINELITYGKITFSTDDLLFVYPFDLKPKKGYVNVSNDSPVKFDLFYVKSDFKKGDTR